MGDNVHHCKLLQGSTSYKRVQLFRVYCLLTGQTYTEDYITFTDVIQAIGGSVKTAPPTTLSFGSKSPLSHLTKAFVLIAPFFDQINTIV